MKTGLKIIYVILGIIICIFTYVLSYNTNGYNYISNLTNEAISAKDYAGVAKIHGGCFDVRNLVTDDGSNSYDLAIFRATNLSQIAYTVDGEATTDYHFEKNYYIYIANISYDTANYSDNTTDYNYTGIRFNFTEGASYDYYFTLSNTINSTVYSENNSSVEASLLHASRNLLEYYSYYSFVNFNLTETLANAMSSVEGSSINSISLINSHNVIVGTYTIDLNYEGEFFDSVEPLVTNYNAYITTSNSSTASDEEKNAAANSYNEFYSSFEASFLANTNYSFRYDDSTLNPSSIVWQSVGSTALAVVVLGLIYFLIFHFKFIKGLFNKNSQKYERYTPSNGTKTGTIITAKTKPVKTNDASDEKETKTNVDASDEKETVEETTLNEEESKTE